MMLPSGNDAAYSIAENLGRLILERDQIEENELS
jgi:D-alanyl-D-alanine carboxypeptidase